MPSERDDPAPKQCNHEWVPFGLKRYSADVQGAEFFRVVDVKCLYCGDMRKFDHGHPIYEP